MGDPRRLKKTYEGPRHPWQEERMAVEKVLFRDYSLKNKRELHKITSKAKTFTDIAKQLTARTGNQADVERKQLFSVLHGFGLCGGSTNLDDVLGLGTKDLLERRLQTIVFRRGFARSMKQARQFIAHQHVSINGTIVTAPNYLVRVLEESQIAFVPTSAFAKDDHPERVPIVRKAKKPRPRPEGRDDRRRRRR